MIRIVGDSHAVIPWKDIKNVKIHHLSGKTAYSIGQNPNQLAFLKDIKAEIIVFCFGEIDCRCHVDKYQPWETTIDNIVRDYIQAISNIPGIKIIYPIMPPSEFVESWIFEGDAESRKKYQMYFNLLLKQNCDSASWYFIDILDEITDDNGFIKRELVDSGTHLNNPGPLIRWFETKGPELYRSQGPRETRGMLSLLENA